MKPWTLWLVPAIASIAATSLAQSERPSFRFAYLDAELLSMEYRSELGFNVRSLAALDFYTGGPVLHGRVGGAYLGSTKYFTYEGGIGIPLSRKHLVGDTSTQVVQWHDAVYEYTQATTFKGRAVNLLLIDLGYRGYSSFSHSVNNIEAQPETVLGTDYANVTDIDYSSSYRLGYFGLKGMRIRERAFTMEELIWYVHGIVGPVNRSAHVWYKDLTRAPYYFDETRDKSELAVGGEVGVRWHMFQSSIGYFDKSVLFTIGYRLGFQFGL